MKDDTAIFFLRPCHSVGMRCPPVVDNDGVMLSFTYTFNFSTIAKVLFDSLALRLVNVSH